MLFKEILFVLWNGNISFYIPQVTFSFLILYASNLKVFKKEFMEYLNTIRAGI